jgi:hypothetical protein
MPKNGYRPLGPGGSGGLFHTCTVLATIRKTTSAQRIYESAMLLTVNYLFLGHDQGMIIIYAINADI